MPRKKSKWKRFVVKKGSMNKIVDGLLHPYGDNIYACLIDSFLHFAVEDNLQESVKKFIKYNLGWLLRCLRKRTDLLLL